MTNHVPESGSQREHAAPAGTAGDIRAETRGIAAQEIAGNVHQENIHGPVIKRVDGNLYYQVIVDEEEVTFDAEAVENEYLSRLANSELATIDTMLGRVPIEKLTIPTYLLPIKPGQDVNDDAGAAISRDTAFRALDALAIAPRLVVVAGPGMGKTTFLNSLATSLAAQRTGDIPVPVSLYRYVADSGGQPLIDFAIRTRFGEMYQGKELLAFSDVLRLWNREGKLLFLLDGLDEVPEDRRRALVDQFAGLTRFVLTTRPIGRVDAYQPEGGTLRLLPLADRDVTRFIYQWATLDGVGPAFEPRVVLRSVRGDSRLADLARVPQLVGLVCYLWSRAKVGGFRTRADLFAQTTDAMISKGLDQLAVGGDERETLPRSLRRWLRKLALDMLANAAGSRLRISRNAMLDDLEIGRSETEAARLFRLARASGLIVRSLDGLDDFQFVHLVFQEYLAAEALAASEDPTASIGRLQHRAALEEPLRMACAIWADRGDDERIRLTLQTLLDPDEQDRFGLNILLAGQCLSEIDNVELRMPDLAATVERGLLDHAGRWWLRSRFAPVIAHLKTDGMRRRLVASLGSEEFHDRWAAAIALGFMGDPSTLEPVLDRLNIEPSSAVSTALIDAVAGIGSVDAVPILMAVLEWLTNEPEPSVFMSTAVGAALARLGAADELISLAPHMDSQPVADAVMEALRYLPTAQASRLVNALEAAGTTVRFSSAEDVDPGPSLEEAEAAAASEDPRVRIAAVNELGRIGNFDARWELLALVTDDEAAVADAAANELENAWSDRWGLLESIDELASLLASSPDAGAAVVVNALWDRPATREALTWSWDEKASEPDDRASAIAALKASDDEDLRRASAVILGLFRAKDHILDLIEMAEDPSAFVHPPAIWALGRIGDPAALPFLLGIRGASDAEIEAVADVLASIHSPEAVTRLIELAQHESPSVRLRGVAGLATGPDVRVVPALLRALDDVDRKVQLAAMNALGTHSDRRSTQQLLGLLSNDEVDVRQAAASGLRAARGADVDRALVHLVEHDDAPEVVFAGLQALGQSGRGREASAALERLLGHEIEDIRVAACEGLVNVASTAVLPALRTSLRSDVSEDVRDAAASAFGRLGAAKDVIELIDELEGPRDFTLLAAVSNHLVSHPDEDAAEISARLAAHDVELRARDDHTALILLTSMGDTKVRIGDPAENVPEGEDPVQFYVGRLVADDPAIRWDAADALGRLKAPAAIRPLVTCLLDPDPVVSHEAARSIQKMVDDQGIHDAAAMNLAAATAETRRAGTLGDLIHLLIEERSDSVTEVMRGLLSVPEAMCELLADETNDDDIAAALWTIGERYNVRFMRDGTVITSNGERLSCEAARQRLGVA
jgi:HEAT repeat protein